MKLLLITVLAFTLAACKDDRPRVNGIINIPSSSMGVICFDNIKYLSVASGGITAKVNYYTRLPERCSE